MDKDLNMFRTLSTKSCYQTYTLKIFTLVLFIPQNYVQFHKELLLKMIIKLINYLLGAVQQWGDDKERQ